MRILSASFSTELNSLYASNNDARALRHSTLEGYEGEWATAEVEELMRDGLCAELVMVWTHHVPQSAKQLLKQIGIKLPLVPTYNKSHPQHTLQTKKIQTEQYTCVTGHNNQEDGWNTTSGGDYAKGWPAEVEYDATGFGPYPFWLGPVRSDITQGAPIHAWWSRTKQAEKFYHKTCQIGNAGYNTSNAPCYHLMGAGNPYNNQKLSYFYTEAEDFCCISGFNDTSGQYQSQVLSAVQWDWMKKMKLNGESDYAGDYYTGKVKNYTMDCSGGNGCGPGNFFIWYYTTLDDKPVEQGEGCQVMPRTSQCSTGGSYLFHQYNQSSWTEHSIDASVFDVPDICLKAGARKSYCLFP